MKKASAQAQPNIALVKYWGKRDHDRNLPAVSSLSLTLETLWSRTLVDFSDERDADVLLVNGEAACAMLPRVSACLDRVAGESRRRALVSSEGNFPIGAGLASSASAFAALVVATAKAADRDFTTHELARLAGAASGSAARSLYGGIVELTAGTEDIHVRQLLDEKAWPLEVIAAITDRSAKPLGSTDAMIRGEQTSPFYSRWLDDQEDDMTAARDAIHARDFVRLGEISEHNCLKMHSVMWTSRPPIVYWNAATLACLETIRELQAKGHAVFFTIDAGPQVKAVCLPESCAAVRNALRETDGVVSTLHSALGDGAAVLPRS